jgi:hypothetical protein
LTFEVDEVVAVTRMYLAEYFEIRYMDITEFVTNMTGTSFVLQQPFVINYTSVAVFNSVVNDDDSVDVVLPPVEELDIVLIAAFTTTNLASYIKLLQNLPPDNIFHTTSNVTFMIEPVTSNNTNTTVRIKNDTNDDSGSSKKGSRQSTKVTAGVTAGTGAFLLALISIMAIRRHKNQNGRMVIDSHDTQPNKRNLNDDEGHMTVAGDTYLAESTVISGGTSSILSSLSANRQRRGQRFRSKRLLSQSRALVLAPHPHTNETQSYLTLTQQPSSPPPSASSPSDVSMRRGLSDIGSNDLYEHDDHASDQEIYENDDFDDDDDRSLLPFYTASPEPAYHGALSVDVNERRHGGQPSQDVLLSMRDDMRLPRHFRSPGTLNRQHPHHYGNDDHRNHLSNQMVLHHDIDEHCGDGDDDTLSVDDDVPLRVIDLIRKFTPTKRHKTK